MQQVDFFSLGLLLSKTFCQLLIHLTTSNKKFPTYNFHIKFVSIRASYKCLKEIKLKFKLLAQEKHSCLFKYKGGALLEEAKAPLADCHYLRSSLRGWAAAFVIKNTNMIWSER
uniref:Uncharacterized protein n=1 Tax=Setaria viridis TaxID=4556 RepID=A0A4U6THX5_SETVI|nr:hypothetical protein SEVIR_8G213700v2 [Setaria viridis]